MAETEKKKHLILSVDDQEENNLFITMILKEVGFDVITTTDCEIAERIAQEQIPSVILLDVMMPRSGFDICRDLKHNESTTNIPVIFISAVHTTVNEIVEGLSAGSNDFVKKPFSPIELIARIKVAIRIKEAEEKIKRLIAVDSLTGLYNRNMMYEFLEKEIETSRRFNESISLIVIDIDLFKEINDTHGHLAGDKALQHLSEVIKGSFRKVDFCCRFAGDEFAIILPRTPLKDAEHLAARLKGNIETLPFQYHDKELNFTTSIGVTNREEVELGITPDKLVREADSALLAAKKQGKNRYVIFEPSILV